MHLYVSQQKTRLVITLGEMMLVIECMMGWMNEDVISLSWIYSSKLDNDMGLGHINLG